MTQSFALRRNTGSIISSFVLALSLISSAGADSKINFESFNQEQALAYSQSAIGRPLEDHVLTVSTGKEINLDQFRGNPLLS